MPLIYFQVRDKSLSWLVIMKVHGADRHGRAFAFHPNLLPSISNPNRWAQFILRLLLDWSSLRLLLRGGNARLLWPINRRRRTCFHPEIIGGL